MTTKQDLAFIAELRIVSGDTTGETLLERAKKELGVWGGMSHSDGVIDELGRVSISFNPETIQYGESLADKIEWLLKWVAVQGKEYDLTFSQWDMNDG